MHGNVTDMWGKWAAVVTVKPAEVELGLQFGSGGSTAGSGGASF